MGQAWYAKRGDREIGPVAQATLEKWAEFGRLRPSDYVRRQNETDWRPASEAVQFKRQSSIAESSQPDPKFSPSDVSSSATPFGEWYEARWLSKLRWYFQITLWLIYGFVWIPIWYVATATPSGGIKRRWGSLSITGRAVACLPLLVFFFIAVASIPNFGPSPSDETSHMGSSSADMEFSLEHGNSLDGVKDKSEVDVEIVGPADDSNSNSKLLAETSESATELRSPILTLNGVSGKVKLCDTGEYLVSGLAVWHIPTKLRVPIPDSDNHYKWRTTASTSDSIVWSISVSPSGKYLACSVLTSTKVDLGYTARTDVSTSARIYRLDGNDPPQLLRETELSIPEAVISTGDLVTSMQRGGCGWHEAIWSEDESSICFASDRVANVLANWRDAVSPFVIAHPKVLSGEPVDFGFAFSVNGFCIQDVDISSDGDQVLLAFQLGDVLLWSPKQPARSELLTFPRCLTSWESQNVEFAENGRVAATVLSQSSGWTVAGGRRNHHTARDWIFLWDTDLWIRRAVVGPEEGDPPNKDSSPSYIGILPDGAKVVVRASGTLTMFQVFDSHSGELIKTISPAGDFRSYWDGRLDSNGTHIIARQTDGPVQVLDIVSGKVSYVILNQEYLSGARYFEASDNSEFIAISYRNGDVLVFSTLASS
ncbi:DUF4339 domain-containing protein [Lignipirellula cremea]|uniref:GYF domain-containing protein n=1 Tax=Lignipirellula cremea TaxID=2528010 RepID=A0A518DQD8_9BACT|nr:DUF4339 domain-containing protein [Lignipirellula cremea]QDU94055.1 hypothetical protein Pla8534_18410 [Lignipirellula cremea]